MKILFIHSSLFITDRYSGQNQTILELSNRLVRAGHKPALLCRQGDSTRNSVFQDREFAFPCFKARQIEKAVTGICLTLNPDVVVLVDGANRDVRIRLNELGLPLVNWCFMPPVGTRYLDSNDFSPVNQVIATTRRISDQANMLWDTQTTCLPPVIEKSAANKSPGNCILLINPKRSKGISHLFRVARQRPDNRFAVLPVVKMNSQWRAACFEESLTCGNIEWLEMTRDMDSVYSRAKILLVPRIGPEGFCRIVCEAQMRGIPVVSSDCGNLEYSVGNGGISIASHQPLDRWLEAIDLLMNDQQAYQRYSDQAKRHANRAELNPDVLMVQFLDILTRAIRNVFNAPYYRT